MASAASRPTSPTYCLIGKLPFPLEVSSYTPARFQDSMTIAAQVMRHEPMGLQDDGLDSK